MCLENRQQAAANPLNERAKTAVDKTVDETNS